MKLHSPELERRLSRRVRALMKQSPELRREAKRVRRRRTTSVTLGVGFFATLFLIGSLLAVGQKGGFPALLAWETILSAFIVIWMVTSLFSTLYGSQDLHALFHVPITDADIFKRQWSRFVRKGTIYMVPLAIMFLCVGLFGNLNAPDWLVWLALFFLQWWLMVVTTVLLASYFPTLPYPAFAWISAALLFVCTIGGKVTGVYIALLMQKLSGTPYWIIPTGFTSFIMEHFRSNNYPALAGGLLISVLYSFTLRPALDRLQHHYRIVEPDYGTIPDLQVSTDDPDLLSDAPAAHGKGPTEITDHILSRDFLTQDNPQDLPWLDRFPVQRLTARERTILEFGRGETRWTRQWKSAATLTGILLILVAAAQWRDLKLPLPLFVVGSLLVGMGYLPLGNPLQRLFNPLFFSGTNVPLYAGLPISYGELSRMIMKLNCMRLLAFSPFLLIYGVSTALIYDFGIQKGLDVTLRGIWLLIALQPSLIVFFFSAGSNDTSRSGLRVGLSIAAMIFLILLFIGLGIGTLLLKAPIAAICGILALAVALLFHWIYGRALNRCRFDLAQIPQQSSI